MDSSCLRTFSRAFLSSTRWRHTTSTAKMAATHIIVPTNLQKTCASITAERQLCPQGELGTPERTAPAPNPSPCDPRPLPGAHRCPVPPAQGLHPPLELIPLGGGTVDLLNEACEFACHYCLLQARGTRQRPCRAPPDTTSPRQDPSRWAITLTASKPEQRVHSWATTKSSTRQHGVTATGLAAERARLLNGGPAGSSPGPGPRCPRPAEPGPALTRAPLVVHRHRRRRPRGRAETP